MTNLIEVYLKKNGPCLSSEIVGHLVSVHNLSPAAARQRVSRAGMSVLRLDLSFPKRARFLFLREQSGSASYWWNLEKALLSSNSSYGFAITALRERGGIMPKSHFEIACGSPIKQKKHLSSSAVLNKLIHANLLKEMDVDGIGPCVYLGLHVNHVETLIPAMKARIFAEDLMLRGLRSWVRKLGFASYNQVAIRSPENNPRVSTTAWDLAGPSYLSPLVTFKEDNSNPNPGFIVCDILLNYQVSELSIAPFLQKLKALRSLRNVGKQLCFFVANSFDNSAFKKLKSFGIAPATAASIFDNDVAYGMRELIEVLSQVASETVSPEKIDTIFTSLGKIEGAANRLRGTLFEFIISETMRSSHGQTVLLNRLCQTPKGSKEADVISVNQKEAKFIEGKGYNLNKKVSLEEVSYWLASQVPIFRAFALSHPDWKDKKMVFEFWTTGSFEENALNLLINARENTHKYEVNFRSRQDVFFEISNTQNKALIKTFTDHFIGDPMTVIESQQGKLES